MKLNRRKCNHEQKKNGTWVYAGHKYDADVVINLDPGDKNILAKPDQ
jgi:hypothetical protein